jgi:hypothetical protein
MPLRKTGSSPVFPGLLFGAAGLLCSILIFSACSEEEPEEVTIIPTPRPTVIVVTASGPYYETFDEAGDWLSGDGTISQGQVVDGQYRLNIDEPSMLAWTHQSQAFGDGIYEVDLALTRGPEASAFGLLLLGSSDLKSFFYCMITGDGRYDIGYCEDGCDVQESLIGEFTLAYTILTGYQTNHLRVELDSGQMTFVINGAPVSQIRNLTYQDGLVGLIVESSPYGGFEAVFDNLHIEKSSDDSGAQ